MSHFIHRATGITMYLCILLAASTLPVVRPVYGQWSSTASYKKKSQNTLLSDRSFPNVAEVVESVFPEEKTIRRRLKTDMFFPISVTNTAACVSPTSLRIKWATGDHLTNKSLSPTFKIPLRI